MKQKSLSIYKFKKGDIITRIIPAKGIPGFEGDIRDRSYIGIPLLLLGIANGCIYVEQEEVSKKPDFDNEEDEMGSAMLGSLFLSLFKQSGPKNLPLDIWDEGWALYIDPYSIGEETKEINSNNALSKYEKIELQEKLKKALEKEDYDVAGMIQKRLNNLK